MNRSKIFSTGFWENNVVFKQILGMCPVLAVSTTIVNGLYMAAASTFVLVCSSIIISSIKGVIPKSVRIPVFIVIIASFVTIVDLTMNAYVHDMHKTLGIFIPLIVVNCMILGRQEAFASKNSVFDSIIDAFGIGCGFALALAVLGFVREFLGSGTIFGFKLFSSIDPAIVMILPPGAFLALGFIIFFINLVNSTGRAKND
ncbi:MAG: electron transport complex subunit E [Deferribacterota bacterium]|nr:electron transport complex subunit E [Deferribacterota bacterium]